MKAFATGDGFFCLSQIKLQVDFKGNPLAFHILRRLGVNFMRMIPMKENEQQKASALLNISMKKQRLLGVTSKIKK